MGLLCTKQRESLRIKERKFDIYGKFIPKSSYNLYKMYFLIMQNIIILREENCLCEPIISICLVNSLRFQQLQYFHFIRLLILITMYLVGS